MNSQLDDEEEEGDPWSPSYEEDEEEEDEELLPRPRLSVVSLSLRESLNLSRRSLGFRALSISFHSC